MPDTAEDADHFGCDAEIDRLVAENVQLRADLDGAKRLNTDLLATLPVEDTSKPVPTTGPKRSFLGYAARTPAPDLRAVLQDTANGMHNFARTASVPDHDAPGWRDCNAAPCARARAALGSATPGYHCASCDMHACKETP